MLPSPTPVTATCKVAVVGALGGGELADGFACKFRDYIDANTALGDGRDALALLAAGNPFAARQAASKFMSTASVMSTKFQSSSFRAARGARASLNEDAAHAAFAGKVGRGFDD